MTARPSEKILESLKRALNGIGVPITVADASTKSGLSLNDTKFGLNYLMGEFRGSLSATSEGELLYGFPTGFSKPWESREKLSLFFEKFKKFGLGILKFVVRAWITIVMVGYVAIFALIVLALTLRGSDRDEDHSSFSGALMFHTLIRLILDSLFWTFHPFSPFSVAHDPYYENRHAREPKTPFYERVNRFFFGPEEKKVDEQELVKLALQEIRAQKGRIGLLDLMRVTGLSKEEADPFMAKLMLNHEGDVTVSEAGGIIYEFPSMRRTTLSDTPSPLPVWEKREAMPPFTGNTSGSNMLIICLNGFNLVMSSIAIANGWTIEKLRFLFTSAATQVPREFLIPPPEGVPLALGWIPLIFSSALFLIPVARALFRGRKKKEIDAKNGKRGLIRAILSKLGFGGIKEETLRKGWLDLARSEPSNKELTQEIIKLGGELEVSETGNAVYRFKAIEAELSALENARNQALKTEKSVGDVIFSSAK